MDVEVKKAKGGPRREHRCVARDKDGHRCTLRHHGSATKHLAFGREW